MLTWSLSMATGILRLKNKYKKISSVGLQVVECFTGERRGGWWLHEHRATGGGRIPCCLVTLHLCEEERIVINERLPNAISSHTGSYSRVLFVHFKIVGLFFSLP